MVDQRYARVLNTSSLNHATEVLSFLCHMTNARDEPFEPFNSTVSLAHLNPESSRLTIDETTRSRGSTNQSIFSDVVTSVTPHGDSRVQDSFLRTGPRFESTPRAPIKSKSAPNESTLIGAPSGKILTNAQLLRDTLFVMQDIPGHYIRWNEADEMFKLDPRHRVDPRDSSFIQTLSLLGFYLRQINAFLEIKRENQAYGMIGQALVIAVDAEVGEYITLLGTMRELPGLTLLMLKHNFEVWQMKLKYMALLF